jgi:hypothetical protein
MNIKKIIVERLKIAGMVKDTKILKERAAAAKRAASLVDPKPPKLSNPEFVESTPLRVASTASTKRKSLNTQLIVERELYTSGENSNDTIYSGNGSIQSSARKTLDTSASNVIQIESGDLVVLKELNTNEGHLSKETHVSFCV